MIRLAIVVEGPTEEAFVNQILLNHLLSLGVVPTPFLIGRRGGNVTVDGLALDMANSFWDFDFVTSLVDFYGFRERGPGEADTLEDRISEAVDSRIKHGWDQSRVFPYVQRHEFEGLLFSDVDAFHACVKRRTWCYENFSRSGHNSQPRKISTTVETQRRANESLT